MKWTDKQNQTRNFSAFVTNEERSREPDFKLPLPVADERALKNMYVNVYLQDSYITTA